MREGKRTWKRERSLLRYWVFLLQLYFSFRVLIEESISFQIALDEAAFLLDLASVEGTWDACVERVADCYRQAALDDIATFILYRD